MKVAIIFVALAAYVSGAAFEFKEKVPFGNLLAESQYANQPMVVVKKVTYYEPELVAVVVEKGVDEIPEETYMIRNYADVLGADSEIHLCSAEDATLCHDKPVTKFMVPSLFKGIGKNGFEDFFEQAKEVPWVSTVNENAELVKPVMTSKFFIGGVQRRKRDHDSVNAGVKADVSATETVEVPELIKKISELVVESAVTNAGAKVKGVSPTPATSDVKENIPAIYLEQIPGLVVNITKLIIEEGQCKLA